MRFDRLRTAFLGGLLLLVAGVPAQAHRGSVCREILGGEYLACTDLQAVARADALAAASTEQLEEQQRQAAKEEAAAAFGAGLRGALELASVATGGDRFELFGLARGRTLEVARAQAAASSLVDSPAPLPRRPAVLVHQALARATLEPATALPRTSEPTSARLRLARFLETRVRAFDLGQEEQHQVNQQFRLGIASDLFHGLWTDPVSGFGYARARWLDHRNASWLSEDPAGTVDSTNLYAYVAWSPQVSVDPLGLKVKAQWHHKLPQAIFRGNEGRDPHIRQLGLTLAEEVDIDAAEYGRLMTEERHIGKGSPHSRYSDWWKRRLARWKVENPGQTVLGKTDIDRLLLDLPDDLQAFNRQGRQPTVNYQRWGQLKARQAKVARGRRVPSTGGGTVMRALGVVGMALSTLTLTSEELAAKERRDELEMSYLVQGYSEDEISERMDLRLRLEYLATETITWPVIMPNRDFDPELKEYLETIPDDVIVPEEDLPWLREKVTEDRWAA